MLDLIEQSKNYLKTIFSDKSTPKIGIILGSGLSDFAKNVTVLKSVDYSAIPNFPTSTVEGHSGKLILAEINNRSVLILSGRFHYYEGYSLKQATFPIYVLKALGIEYLLLSNASGGLNKDFKIGDLMLIEDHIHLFPDNPLRGKNLTELGPRFPDMSEPYNSELLEIAEKVAEQNSIPLQKGVYLGTAGPTYETPSEYGFFARIGADAVGMSTTPETIVAIHAGLKVFGISVISDMGVEGQIVEISHEEVQEVAKEVSPKLDILFKGIIEKIEV